MCTYGEVVFMYWSRVFHNFKAVVTGCIYHRTCWFSDMVPLRRFCFFLCRRNVDRHSINVCLFVLTRFLSPCKLNLALPLESMRFRHTPFSQNCMFVYKIHFFSLHFFFVLLLFVFYCLFVLVLFISACHRSGSGKANFWKACIQRLAVII